MRQKLTLITLGVKDFQKALAFYEGLGWKKSQQSQEAYALFPLGGIVLVLEEDDVWTEELKVEEGKCYKRKDSVQRIKILKKTITLIFLCNFAKGKSYFTD